MTLASSPLLPAAVICGAGTGLGLWLAITALLPACLPDPQVGNLAAAWWSAAHSRQPSAAVARRAGLALAAAVIAPGHRMASRDRVASLAAWAAPSVLGRDQDAAGSVARIEAVAGWTEMLRDTTSAAAGLEQAIAATAPLAPEAIRPPSPRWPGRPPGNGWRRRCASSPPRSPTRSPTWLSLR